VLQVLCTNSSSVRFSKDTNVILLSMHDMVWSGWFFCGWELNQCNWFEFWECHKTGCKFRLLILRLK
jgi:hypothetical protein